MAHIVTAHTQVRSEYDLRDSVLNALNEVYAPDFAGKDWYVCHNYVAGRNKGSYALEVNLQLVTDIFALIAFAAIDPENNTRQQYYGETMFSRIHEKIWIVHPGGSTAEYAAEKVCAILNIPKEK